MHRPKRLLLVFLTLISCVGCDQATKGVAKEYLPRNEIISFAGDVVRLQLTENRGAFLGLGATLPEGARDLVFIIAVAAIVFALLGYLFVMSPAPLTATGLSLICGGGLGNLIDRIAYGGYVVDFLNLGIGGLRTGIFNLADVAIMAGAAIVFLSGAKFGARTDLH